MLVDLSSRYRCFCLLSALILVAGQSAVSFGQGGGSNPLQFRIDGPTQRLEMIVSSSRILTLDKEIPRALVNNTEIVRVVPLSPNQVQVSALMPGVTTINLWDESGDVHSVDVVVFGDARQLEMLLKSEFPHAALRIRPLASSVVISGYVDRPEIVGRIIRMAEDYYPKVINNITVGGVQQVALHVKVMEVSRTKMRSLGFDWALFDGSDFVFQGVSGLVGSQPGEAFGDLVATGAESLAVGVVDTQTQFYAVLEALRQNNLLKVLAEPTLVTVSGRPASFNSGGEFPILVPQSLGTISVEFKEFGTRVDFVPIVLGNGNIRLEVRPQVSEVDNSRGVSIDGNTVPGLRRRWADTAAELRAGQTLAVAGLIQSRTEASNVGLPWLSDLPWVGAAFRKVKEEVNEIELLIMVRPELVDALDPHEVPCKGPGQFTTSPKDVDLYLRGYLEVPKCCPDGSCGECQSNGLNLGPEIPAGPATAPPQGTMPETPAYPNGSETIPVPSDAAMRGADAFYGNAAVQQDIYGRESNTMNNRPGAVSAYQNTPAGGVRGGVPTNSSDPLMPSDSEVQYGLFGPSGYDKLDQ